MNFNCFHTFSTEIKNYRAYFRVGGIFNERRHLKYVQTNINMLECCRDDGCRLPTDLDIHLHAHDSVRSTAVEEFQNSTYLKNMPRTLDRIIYFCCAAIY
jgi:hypothetical protein